MSIEQLDKIDIISTGKNGRIVLTISDHFEWDDQGEHALLLQDKINAYLHFIETGQIFEENPGAKGRKIAITISLKYIPNEEGLDFLKQCREVVSNLGYKLDWNNPAF